MTGMKTAAILVARLIFAFVFAMAASFKFAFMGIDATTGEIAGAGFPFPHLLAWVAAFAAGLLFAAVHGPGNKFAVTAPQAKRRIA
jgi:uncharacterized membrane protein YphA (DoxX/SURF4 family)